MTRSWRRCALWPVHEPCPRPQGRTLSPEAEQVIGFRTPPLLRPLYSEVANGGFGLDDDIPGVGEGQAQGNFYDIAELYQDGPGPSGRIPAGLVLIYDWDCTTGHWSTSVTLRATCGATTRESSGAKGFCRCRSELGDLARPRDGPAPVWATGMLSHVG